MKRIILSVLGVLLLTTALVWAQDEVIDPVAGKWICDYSQDGGPIVELTLADGEFTAEITTPESMMTWNGTYTFDENTITFTMETGSLEGAYDSENDQISVEYEGVSYVFDRIVEEEEY
jgi:hypothetical protein